MDASREFFRLLVGVGLLGAVVCCANGQVVDNTAYIEGGSGDTGTGTEESGPGDDSGTGDDSGSGSDAGKDSTPPPDDSGSGGGKVVINEIQAAGAAGASDEFVELYNPTSSAVSLSGWMLMYSSSAGSTPGPRFTGTSAHTIPAHGYFVIGGTGFPPSGADATLTSGLAPDGQVGLMDTSSTIDGVGYGAITLNTLGEGSPAPSPATSQSIGRKPNGTDSNHNSVDFKVMTTPTPGAAN